MNANQQEDLLEKYNKGLCTEEEKAIIESWFLNEKENKDVVALSKSEIDDISREIWDNLIAENNIKANHPIKLWRLTISAAAILLIAFGTGLYFSKKNQPATIAKHYTHDVAPGGNNATLTLANGKVINLSNSKTGVIINANNLAYSDGTSIIDGSNNAGTQTISTPKGGQYQIVLPDGTHVWLNAATTLKFPQSFAGTVNRKVELSGEAYFEVAKDKTHPFIVKSKQQDLQVLGTHFNVSAYDDEASTRSTLLEGCIKIDSKTILRPGDQSTKTATSINVKQVDTDNDVAWKNGEFMFRKESLESIMRKIARWYDVEVIYEDSNQAKKLFGGEISRFTNVSEVLNMLQLTGQVHFKIEGRRIMVVK